MASLTDRARIAVRKPTRAAGFVGLTAGFTAAYSAAEAMAVRGGMDEPGRARLVDEWTARWSRALLRLFAVRVQLDGALPPKEPGRGRLVVANHRSAIDIGVVLGAFGGHMVSRADLGGWPILGAAAKKAGTLFVDRDRASSGAELIRAMRDRLKAGATICIFPEGTTFAGDEVRPFHPGAFAAAYRSGCEIIPVGLAYESGSAVSFVDETFLAHLSRVSGAAPTRVVAAIGEAIPSDGVRTAELRDEAHRRVSECTLRARRTVDG